MRKKVILIAVIILFSAAVSLADTIVLKSGKQIEEAAPVKTPPAETKPAGEKLQLPEEVSVTVKKEPQGASLKVDVKEPAAPAKSYKAEVDAAKLKRVRRDMTIVLLVIMFILFLVYIYSSICLQFIAKKTNTSPSWLAWIPAGNIFLMCKIGGVNYWWMLALLLLFGPLIISMAVSFGFFGFVWYKIAQARNKPGWVGILAVIPIVQFFIYGYLAFTNHKATSTPPQQPPSQ